MNMMFKAFARKLFGAGYERLRRALIVELIVFGGLHTAGLTVRTAPSVLYLMTSVFTAGVMWQALSSEDNAAYMQNLLMLPFRHTDFVFSYTAALGAYVLLTKTAVLLAVVFAVSGNGFSEAAGCLLCAANAVLITAAVFSGRHTIPAGCLWAAAVTAAIVLLRDTPWLLPLIAASGVAALLLLRQSDGYAFYACSRRSVRSRRHVPFCLTASAKGAVWRYLFRYMNTHRNYFLNTAVMWGIACALPVLMPAFYGASVPGTVWDSSMDSTFAIPVALSLLTLNTPVCILLSVDPALEQAVRFLPGQKRAFCLPYCLFIFLCNLTAESLFLLSWQIQIGGMTALTMLTAVFFALQSAVFSVLLEWFFPLRGWKTESDLWHHPRKYIVPSAMLLLAGIVGTLPSLPYVLCLLLTLEIAVLLFHMINARPRNN